MKKISRLSASIFAGFLACLSGRPGFVQAMIVSFLAMPIGLVEAGDPEMARVIELHLVSASPHVARDDLSALRPTDNTATVLSQRRIRGELPKQRNPELSQQHLFVVGLNAQGEETSRTVMLDPRILRAETAESSGQLTSSELFYRNDVIFSVTIPDDASAIALRIYQPRWTGTEFALDLIGEANLPEVDHD
ncbi:MAG: hypothetical protein ACREYF_23835 [Gammaproteobacteria bacterium]